MPSMPGDRLFGVRFVIVDNVELRTLWQAYMGSAGNDVKPARARLEAAFPRFFGAAEVALKAIVGMRLTVDRLEVQGMNITAYAVRAEGGDPAAPAIQSESYWIGA